MNTTDRPPAGSRPRRYGDHPSVPQARHYVQVMVYGDCHQKLRELMERHNLSAS